jgi:hypothetical protein
MLIFGDSSQKEEDPLLGREVNRYLYTVTCRVYFRVCLPNRHRNSRLVVTWWFGFSAWICNFITLLCNMKYHYTIMYWSLMTSCVLPTPVTYSVRDYSHERGYFLPFLEVFVSSIQQLIKPTRDEKIHHFI